VAHEGLDVEPVAEGAVVALGRDHEVVVDPVTQQPHVVRRVHDLFGLRDEARQVLDHGQVVERLPRHAEVPPVARANLLDEAQVARHDQAPGPRRGRG
jgi:hypothetical protein